MATLCSVIKRGILVQNKSTFLIFVRNKKIQQWEDGYFYPKDNQPTYVYASKSKKNASRYILCAAGSGMHGQLGLPNLFLTKDEKMVKQNSTTRTFRPIALNCADGAKVQDVACGIHFTIAAFAQKDNVSCYGTGLATDGQIGIHYGRDNQKIGFYFDPMKHNKKVPFDMLIKMSPIKFCHSSAIALKVASGRAHSIILANNGFLYTFGNNSYGQCGRKIIFNEDYKNESNFHEINIFKDRAITHIECGLDSSYVVCDGKVFSCGLSADGQSGQEVFDTVEQFCPVVGDINEEEVLKVACSADCVLAVTKSGNVYGWGNGEYRQFSMVSDEAQLAIPVKLPLNLGKIIDVAATGSTCFVLNECGDVYSWGHGWLGRGPENDSCSKPEIIPSTLFGRTIINPESKVTQLHAGVSMIAAVNTEGNLYTWGKNLDGCLGLSHKEDMYFPLRVCMSKKVTKVSCGEGHMAIIAKGKI